jgi:hypothetical protein
MVPICISVSQKIWNLLIAQFLFTKHDHSKLNNFIKIITCHNIDVMEHVLACVCGKAQW